MPDRQSWRTCRYAVSADGGGEMVYELREHGFSECYLCSHPEVIKSGVYPLEQVDMRDGASQKIACLTGMLIGGELSPEGVSILEKRVAAALDGCARCGHHEPI